MDEVEEQLRARQNLLDADPFDQLKRLMSLQMGEPTKPVSESDPFGSLSGDPFAGLAIRNKDIFMKAQQKADPDRANWFQQMKQKPKKRNGLTQE
jgi:hypothetical protein